MRQAAVRHASDAAESLGRQKRRGSAERVEALRELDQRRTRAPASAPRRDGLRIRTARAAIARHRAAAGRSALQQSHRSSSTGRFCGAALGIVGGGTEPESWRMLALRARQFLDAETSDSRSRSPGELQQPVLAIGR